MSRRLTLVLLLPLLATTLLLGAGCSKPADPGPETPATETPAGTPAETPAEATPQAPSVQVKTLSYPVDWLVARLASDAVARSLVMPAGESPLNWRPSAEAIVEMQGADLIVLNGAGYEKWTEQASLPLSRMLDTSSGLDLIEVIGRTHSHGSGGEHSHAGLDPHLWMDPDLYLEQARRIDEKLAGLNGSKGALAELEAELAQLATDFDAALGPLRGVSMAASHPSFAYLARRFGLEIEDVDLDPAAPDAEQITAFEAWAAEKEPAILWWIEEPSEKARAALPEPTRHLVLDPLEQPAGASYDYLAQARANLERLKELAGEI